MLGKAGHDYWSSQLFSLSVLSVCNVAPWFVPWVTPGVQTKLQIPLARLHKNTGKIERCQRHGRFISTLFNMYGKHLQSFADLKLQNKQFKITPRKPRIMFFFPHSFCRYKVSRSCFTGQFPGIGTVFILASLQMDFAQDYV